MDKTRHRSFIADPVLNLETVLGFFIRLSSFNYSFEILKQFLGYKIFKVICLIDRHFKKKIVYDLTSFFLKNLVMVKFGQILLKMLFF